MKSPKWIKKQLQEQIQKVIQNEFGIEVDLDQISFTTPPNSDLGDFACNICLKISKQLSKKPVNVANQLLAKISLPDQIQDIEVVNPGFLNFRFNNSYLQGYLFNNTQLSPKNQENKPKTIVEYSSPNIAKPLGVHHILTTVIGQSISNILEFRGQPVIKMNYLGDWGTQFGKVITAYKLWGDKSIVEKDPLNELLKLYVEFHNKAEEDDSLNDKARQEHVKLEQKDQENMDLYDWIRKLSIQGLQKVYGQLGGINFDVNDAESYRLDQVEELLQEGKKQKIFLKGEEGAFIATFEDENIPPYLVQKKDGSTLYSTRDIATIKQRIQDYSPKQIVYVVDVAQKLHFQQLFDVSKRFNWFTQETELTHLSFGRMSFKDKKMSTRKGNILSLQDVLEEAEARSLKIIQDKNPDLKDQKQAANIIGSGAIKYSILSQSPDSNLVFDWDKVISFEGNSGPYLQYSYARSKSILRKNNQDIQEPTSQVTISTQERNILNKLFIFRDTAERSKNKLKPNLLAKLLFDLAQEFNSYYANTQILKEENQDIRNFRLKLTSQFAETIKKGLQLLGGIEVLEEM